MEEQLLVGGGSGGSGGTSREVSGKARACACECAAERARGDVRDVGCS